MAESELPSTSTWFGSEGLTPIVRGGRRIRLPAPRVRVPGSHDADIHAPARRNDGRPPPTTVWGPDRPPRPLPAEEVRTRAPKGRRRGHQVMEELSDATSEYDDEYYD